MGRGAVEHPEEIMGLRYALAAGQRGRGAVEFGLEILEDGAILFVDDHAFRGAHRMVPAAQLIRMVPPQSVGHAVGFASCRSPGNPSTTIKCTCRFFFAPQRDLS